MTQKGQEAPQLDPLGNTPGHNRTGSTTEYHLEEPVRSRCVATGVVTGQGCGIISGPEPEAAHETTVDTGVHQVVTDNVEEDAGNTEQGNVFQTDGGNVFGTDQTGFEHTENQRPST